MPALIRTMAVNPYNFAFAASKQMASQWGRAVAPSPNDHRDVHLAVSLQLCLARLLDGWGLDGKL